MHYVRRNFGLSTKHSVLLVTMITYECARKLRGNGEETLRSAHGCTDF